MSHDRDPAAPGPSSVMKAGGLKLARLAEVSGRRSTLNTELWPRLFLFPLFCSKTVL